MPPFNDPLSSSGLNLAFIIMPSKELGQDLQHCLPAAEREIETITVDQARTLYGGGGVVFVDIRDIRELPYCGA